MQFTGTLALTAAFLALVAAGCGKGSEHPGATAAAAGTTTTLAPCKLDRSQRRTVTRALADIGRLRRIQAPVQTFSYRGAPGQDVMTGKFEIDLGSPTLKVDTTDGYVPTLDAVVQFIGAGT